MGEDNSDVTKLVIMVVGVAAISLFAYLIFRERQTIQTNQLSQLSDLSNLEQKIMQLNEKVDNFKIQQLSNHIIEKIVEPERKTVSLKSKPRATQPRSEFFGMV
jgi:cell division protein FtsL